MSGQADPAVDVAAQILVLRPKLRHLAVRLTNNWADADDLVQLAMVKALEFRGRMWRNTNLKAWLRTVMHHQVIDDSRRARRRVPWVQQLDQLPAPNVRAPDQEAEVVWEALSSDDVKQALARCPAPLRLPFELQQFQGLSLEEIAGILAIPRATVATRLFRVRARLRRMLTASA